MFTQNEIKVLKDALPASGLKQISLEENISIVTVHKFFRGTRVKDETAERIWTTGWEIIRLHNEKVERLKLLMNDTLKNVNN